MSLPSPTGSVINPPTTAVVRNFGQVKLTSKSTPNANVSNLVEHQTVQNTRRPSTNSTTNDGPHIQHNVNAVAGLVNSVIQDISRCQLQMCENEWKLADAKAKLQKIEELADSLGETSPTTLPIIAPLLKKMRAERRSLEVKGEQDIKKLTEAWEQALNIFLRAICEQFDKEVEAGTEFLYQEARVFFDSLSKKYMTPSQKSASSPSKPTNSLSRRPDPDETPGQSLTRTACFHNGFNTRCQSIDFMDTHSKMQEQLDIQSEKIKYLLHQNELMQNLYSQNAIPPFSL